MEENEIGGEEIATENNEEKILEGEQIELMMVSMNGEEFLIPVHEVSEILRPVAVTPVPMAPDHLLGVANIHGQVVCIVDPGKVLRLKQERAPQSERTRYLILRHPRMHLGIWVDAVSELFRVAKSAMPEAEEDSRGHLLGEMDIDGHSFKLLNAAVLFE